MSEQTTSKLPIWLVVSLIANALLIGVLIGGGLGHRKAGPPAGGGDSGGNEQALMRGIDRSAAGRPEAPCAPRLPRGFCRIARRTCGRLREARQRLSQLLAAETYDAEAVQREFQTLARSRYRDARADAGCAGGAVRHTVSVAKARDHRGSQPASTAAWGTGWRAPRPTAASGPATNPSICARGRPHWLPSSDHQTC